MTELGYKPKGVRLDSGDLAQLSKDCKKLWKEIGEKYGHDFSELVVVASDGINERKLKEFNTSGHEIDIYGIGTNLVTCEAQPALGMVYKLVENEGKPKIKLSETKEKVLIPGRKNVFRVYDKEMPSFDIMTLAEEEDIISGKPLTAYHPFNDGDTKSLEAPAKVVKLTQMLYEGDKVQFENQTIHKKRNFVLKQIDEFDPTVVKSDETEYVVYLSQKCKETFDNLLKKAKIAQP